MAGTYRFDDVEIDTRNFRLAKSGKVVPVEPKTLHLLIFLIENRTRLLARREILDAVWQEAFVSDHVLNRTIGQLRKALGDDAKEPRYIETVPTLGYRFIGHIEESTERADGSVQVPLTSEAADTKVPAPSEKGLSFRPDGEIPPKKARLPRPFLIALATAGSGILLVVVLWQSWIRHSGIAPPASPPPMEQRITANSPDAPVDAAAISPDGKYIAYSDMTGLYLRHIASGETHSWQVPNRCIATPNGWFPDGTHLLVTCADDSSGRPSLWKLSVLGSAPRMLLNNAAAGAISPDGATIAYLPGIRFPQGNLPSTFDPLGAGSEIWLMDSEGANARKILSVDQTTAEFSGSRFRSLAWSPHGKRIACIERHGLALSDPTVESFSLRTINASGGDLQIVLSDALLKPALAWIADSRIVYAYNEDSLSERGDQQVRSIRVDEGTGKAIGQPQPVTRSQGSISGLSATADGKRLVIARRNIQPQVFISEFKAGSHRLEPPRRLTLEANGNLAEAWTPDSKAVFFVSNRHGTWKLFRQAIDQTTAEVLVEGRSLFLPRLSPDGSQILYLSYTDPADPSQAVALMRVPVSAGPSQQVLQATGITNHQCAASPSRLCILSRQAGSDHTFFSFDLDHGAGRALTRTDHFANWSLSRDGAKLAIFLDEHVIRFFDVNTGAVRDVRVDDWKLDNGDWSAAGNSLLMQSMTKEGLPVILDVDEAGKATVVLKGVRNIPFKWLVPSPDGRFAILEAEVPGDNNVWMVEHF